MGFDKWKRICIQHCSGMQKRFITLKIPSDMFSLSLPLIHCILCYHWSLCDIYSSVFFRMSSNWKHAVYGFFQTRLFHLAIYIEDSFMPHGPATWPWQIHYLWGVGGATGHIHMVILHFFLPEPCGDFSHSFTMRTWWSFWG